MSNTILLKRNGNVAAVPAAASLSYGELSLNYADGVLYFLNLSNVVTVLANASTAAGTQLVNGTSNVVTRASGNVTISSAGTANVLTVSSTGTVVSGTQSVTGNITGGNISTAGLLSASNNLIVNSPSPQAEGGQLILAWANTTVTGQANSTWNIDVDNTTALRMFYQNGVGATSVMLSASPTSNIISFPSTAGISATGNVTGSYFIGNGSQLTGITAAGGSSITNGTSNVVVAASGNVTVGVASTAAVATFATTGEYVTGIISATGNITGGNISATNHTGTNVSVTGTVTAASTVGGVITGSSASVSGTVTGASLTGTITTASQTNITSVGTLGALSVTGNITGGNISATNHTGTTVSVTGVITGASVVGGVITGTSVSVSGGVTAASVAGGVITGSSASVTGNVTGGNVITSGSGGNITGANVISATTINTSQITNSGANGVGNIGTSTTYFNTVFAKATSAQYADLAEMYSADADYQPGTVVEFGGSQEITISSSSHSTQVAGIISTNPSYLMNSAQVGEHVLAVALTGRVPCQVVGTIRKGDRLVADSISGVATVLNKDLYEPGCIIGKALENYDSDKVGIIEVAVGRF